MKKIIAALFLAVSAFPSYAFTECTAYVNSAYMGDGGYWIIFPSVGPSGYWLSSSADFTSVRAATLLAIATSKQLTIRYAASGVSCTTGGTRSDATGAWIWNN